MDKRFLKTVLTIVIAIVLALMLPIFAQWYEKQTGISPDTLYGIGTFGGFILMFFVLFKIWE
jgi:hypothetical protein